jgi:hypothetical protein
MKKGDKKEERREKKAGLGKKDRESNRNDLTEMGKGGEGGMVHIISQRTFLMFNFHSSPSYLAACQHLTV